ncbi:PREDICTED: ferruginol synthase-like [Erythranthe guttata]|uniref:ferruginol synthase-like n=1 Tax=Erythranthe guttata TaxID=4155 RepID=UPI00064D8DD8|nr:PREDICTED: ferruginol synthase-like [Erythranthe guttata]|eukprot:XP_012855807.1 PREDICTED: ferruginol synthase-like [Erythranthe guttata]
MRKWNIPGAVQLYTGGDLSYLVFTRRDPSHRNLPPGPKPFPIVGNIFQIGQNPHKSLAKLSKTYGPLMSLKLGSIYTIVVSSPEIAKEILQKHDQNFSGRTIPAAMQAHDHHKISMAFLPIADRHVMAGTANAGRAVNIGEAAFVTTLNLMSVALFSTELTTFGSKAATEEFRQIIVGLQNTAGVSNFSDYFPLLQPLDPQGIKRKAQIYFGKMLAVIDDLMNQRLEESRTTNKIKKTKKTDLMETLLDLHKEEISNEYHFTTELIKHFLLDLFVAGFETTASTVEWAMTELLLNPDILLKVKQEVKNVAKDNGKTLNESEIIQLPYLQAVIKETFRYHPPGPLLFPRKSEHDAQVSGYLIPKGTQVLVNVWAMGRDPAIWSDPESFRPERFLSDKNNTTATSTDFKGQHFELIPFGAGRRICPGIPLANRMLHIMVATLIHNFDWKLVEEEGQDHTTELLGLALHKSPPLMAIPIIN